jgi:hypothetical protein
MSLNFPPPQYLFAYSDYIRIFPVKLFAWKASLSTKVKWRITSTFCEKLIFKISSYFLSEQLFNLNDLFYRSREETKDKRR